MPYLQSKQPNTMTDFVMLDPTDEELNELDTVVVDMHHDCFGDDYADAVMMGHLEDIHY